MKRINRRDFIAASGVSVGAITLGVNSEASTIISADVLSSDLSSDLMRRVFVHDPISFIDIDIDKDISTKLNQDRVTLPYGKHCVIKKYDNPTFISIGQSKTPFINHNVINNQFEVELLKWNSIEEIEVAIVQMLLLTKGITSPSEGEGTILAKGDAAWPYEQLRLTPGAQKALGGYNIYLNEGPEFTGLSPQIILRKNRKEKIVPKLGLVIVTDQVIEVV